MRRIRPHGMGVGFLVTLVVLYGSQLAVHIPSAMAVSQHNYSIGFDLTPSPVGDTGVQVTRWDRHIDAGATCSYNLHSLPIYFQDQWINITEDAQNWLELGTASWNPSCNAWFEAYGYQGVYYPFNQQNGAGYGQHAFTIVRQGDGVDWSFKVDVTTMGFVYWPGPVIGVAAYAGDESWNPNSTVSAHGYYGLEYNVGGPWYSFGTPPEPSETVRVDSPPMCGRFISNNLWQAAENALCN